MEIGTDALKEARTAYLKREKKKRIQGSNQDVRVTQIRFFKEHWQDGYKREQIYQYWTCYKGF